MFKDLNELPLNPLQCEICRILGVSASELQESFNVEAIDSIKGSSNYARNFLEYCSFRALAVSTHNTGYLADKRFRRLTFDMMIAWEAPASPSLPELNVRFCFYRVCTSELENEYTRSLRFLF